MKKLSVFLPLIKFAVAFSPFVVLGPFYVVLVLLFSGLETVLKSSKFFKAILEAAALLLVVIPAYYLSRYEYEISGGNLIFVFGTLFLMWVFVSISSRSMVSVAFFLGLLCIYHALSFSRFWAYRDPGAVSRILSQAEVKSVLLQPQGTLRRIYVDPEEQYLLGVMQDSHENASTVVKVSLRKPEPPAYLHEGGARDASFYKENVFVTLHEKPEILKINLRDFMVKKRLPVDMKPLMNVVVHDPSRQLLVTSENRKMQSFDLSSFNKKINMIIDGNPYTGFFSEDKKTFFIAFFVGKYAALQINPYTLKIQNKLMRPWWVIMGAGADFATRRLFLASTFTGRLHVIDLKTFSPVRSLYLGTGLREVLVDNRRNLLYVGNFITGKLLVMDLKNLKLLREFYLGDKLRALTLSPKSNILFAASVYGIFRVEQPIKR